MKICIIIIRILLGLLLVFASVAFFLNLIEPPEMVGDILLFNQGLAASGYVFPVIKTIQLLCGLALLAGIFVPLATVVLFPIALNILLVHLFLDPAGLPFAIFLIGANLFLAYACRKHYRTLFSTTINQP